jgi:Protein of unknown function (DUF2637)
MVTQSHQPAIAHRTAIITASAVVAPLLCALAALGGIGSFTTVRDLARPWFGQLAWIVPVGVDLGILALLAWDLLAEYLGLSWPVLRWIAWAFITATVYLNIAAGHGNPTAAIMHAAMPSLFITVIEGIRHLIRQLTGLATGTRIERIPLSRWLLAPLSTALLARSMILWHVTSYRDGLHLEYQRQLAISRLQQDHGRWQWRWRAPLADRLALRLTPAQAGANTDSAAPALAISTLPDTVLGEPSVATTPLTGHDQRLLAAATDIVKAADAKGLDVSQASLARQLRTRGLTIANQRLAWLATAVRAQLEPESPPEG